GVEQPRLEDPGKRLAGAAFDDATQYVGRVAVVPGAARLIGERHAREPLDEIGVADVAPGRDVGVLVRLLDHAVAEEAVGEPGRMAHQVLDRHRAYGGDELERLLPLRVG